MKDEKKPDNPAAFPIPSGTAFARQDEVIDWNHEQYGMTLRDYFAAKTMAAMFNDTSTDEQIAKAAYDLADAMLKERQI